MTPHYKHIIKIIIDMKLLHIIHDFELPNEANAFLLLINIINKLIL